MSKKTLQIDDKKARKLFKGATTEFKEMLIDTFGDNFFSQKITDRIKSFEDVCEEAGKDIRDYITTSDDAEDIVANALKRLRLAYKVFQQDWRADYNNSSQAKYFPVFVWNGSGFGFAGAASLYDDSRTPVGLRLCLPDPQLVEYVANLMIEEHNILLTKQATNTHDKENTRPF